MSSPKGDSSEGAETFTKSIGNNVLARYPNYSPSRLQRIAARAKLAFKGYLGSKQASAGVMPNEEEMRKLIGHANEIRIEIQTKTIIYIDEKWVESKFGIEELSGFSGSALGFGGGISLAKIYSGEERFWAVSKKCTMFTGNSVLPSHVGKSLRFDGTVNKDGGPIKAEGKEWNSFKLVLGALILDACYLDENLKAGWSIDDVTKLSKVSIVSDIAPSPKLFVRAIYAGSATLRVPQPA